MTTPKTEAGRRLLDEGLSGFWREDQKLVTAIEQEAGRLAVAEALSVERIAENLTSLFQQAFPTTDRDEMAYLIDSWIWAEGAAALRAALSPEQPEVTE